jgi:hypothetical protein
MGRFRIAATINREYFPKEALTVDLDDGDKRVFSKRYELNIPV